MNENLNPEWAESPKANIFARVFNGDVSLPITYWVWGGLGNAISAGIYATIEFNYASIVVSQYGYFFLNMYYWIAFAYLIFIWVAIWRSAGKYQGSRWGSVARFMVGMGILSFVGQIMTELNQGLDDEASITEEVRLMNLSLPTMLDESTRMDSVSYFNNRIAYSHTVIDSTVDEYDIELFNSIQRTSITDSLCFEQDTKEGLELGLTYAYAYVDMYGTLIAEIEIDQSDCE